uniref:N-alpha-acetyltransferase 30 n=1 Tax=Ciona intestinalis TaxID=7719 RepID=F6WJZ0_CIOIN|nr:N-alpha-acetyltransferase 30 [Ciona intestinalis]XP_026695912.1 N-alpha-acetyltransferase 30 [Ciona intestinalis]|eukprot:XP_002119286.1 N-alpha-acetyltransferase 30 [Ciona intestinalis]
MDRCDGNASVPFNTNLEQVIRAGYTGGNGVTSNCKERNTSVCLKNGNAKINKGHCDKMSNNLQFTMKCSSSTRTDCPNSNSTNCFKNPKNHVHGNYQKTHEEKETTKPDVSGEDNQVKYTSAEGMTDGLENNNIKSLINNEQHLQPDQHCTQDMSYALSCLTISNTKGLYPINATNDDHSENIVCASNGICYARYSSELQMPAIMHLITKDLSEPYSIYTYRYFIHNWPHLCYLAIHEANYVGAIVCKLDLHKKITRRGYIAMLAVDESVRRKKIGTNLVKMAIEAMVEDGCDEVVLETEVTNQSALNLYENLGFIRDKRLFRYYLNGVDALRLKLWLC